MNSERTKGKLLILVGGSSAGKTSLAKALQEQVSETYLLMGIDLFWFTLPPKQLNLDTVEPEYYRWSDELRDGKQFFRITPGPILDAVMMARYHAIREFLERGLNVVADDVIWSKSWLEECVKTLTGQDVTFIKIFCSDEVGAQREIDRGDRHIGWNRGSAYYSNQDCLYDLEIDTTASSPAECAAKIVSKLSEIRPSALMRMKERFGLH